MLVDLVTPPQSLCLEFRDDHASRKPGEPISGDSRTSLGLGSTGTISASREGGTGKAKPGKRCSENEAGLSKADTDTQAQEQESSQRHQRDAEASPPGPWLTSPVSSGESSTGWDAEPGEPPDAPTSCQPCSPPCHRLFPDGSFAGPWQTCPLSLTGSPLSWGPKPGKPPETASSWQPCSAGKGQRDAEGSPADSPGPWQTSPCVFLFLWVSPELGQGSVQQPEAPAGRRGQPAGTLADLSGPVGGGAQPATAAASLAAADGPLAHLLRLFGRVSPELGRRHLGDPWGPLHSSEAPAGGRAQPTAGALADLPRLLRGVSSGLSCSSGLGLSRGSQLVSHHPHTSAAVARVQAGKARSGTDMA
ncbi:hypothetical protein R6Z07M_019411 [Ovis aries]